jgi:cytoskeleton protein RodZ
MEGLGTKFQKARTARGLTIDEAARMTKIRPSKLAEIEAEDFSQFPSLAYAKGFVQIYGKFLNVDVSPYLEAFETSEHMTVDGYSYLQDNPAPPPRRTEVVRKTPSDGNKSSLMPLVIGLVVLVVGFWFLKLMMDLKRIKPNPQRDGQTLAQSSVAPVPAPATSGPIVAPRALPADGTPAPTAPPTDSSVAAVPAATNPMATPAPTPPALAAASPAATPPAEEEPEIRRAEPVRPEDLAQAQGAPAADAVTGQNRFDIRPLKKAFMRVVVDDGGPLQRWIDVSERPLQFRGQRIAVKLSDPTAVEIRKNGKPIARGDADVRLE